MRTKSAVTLVEVLAVISIILVLTAILAPVVSSAKDQAAIVASESNMRQLVSACVLYASDQSDTGGPSGLGLPTNLVQLLKSRKLPKALFDTHGNPEYVGGPPVYRYMPPAEKDAKGDLGQAWIKHVDSTGNNPIILIDGTHNPTASETEFFRHRLVFGAYLSGSLRKQHLTGPYAVYERW